MIRCNLIDISCVKRILLVDACTSIGGNVVGKMYVYYNKNNMGGGYDIL